jgi:hypothetical protein
VASQRDLADTLKGKGKWPPRIAQHAAGYMELAGAKKDGECKIVHVEGGLSRELGCCNLFEPEAKDTCRFSCGTCEYVTKEK